MLALVSSSSDSAMGRFDRLKKVTSCLTPSSNTWNVGRFEIGDEPSGRIGDGDVERDQIDAGAERRLLGRHARAR